MGPSDKAYLRTLWWKPVRSALEGDVEDVREGIHIPQVWSERVYLPPEVQMMNLRSLRLHSGEGVQKEAGHCGVGQSYQIWSHCIGGKRSCANDEVARRGFIV